MSALILRSKTTKLFLFNSQFDLDKSGYITAKELGNAFAACNHVVPGYKLREIVESVDKDKNGKVSFDEFQEIYKQTTSKGVFGEWKASVSKREGIDVQGGLLIYWSIFVY